MYENSYAYIPQWLNVQCIDALPKIKLFVQKKIKSFWSFVLLLRCCSLLQCAMAMIPQHLVPVFMESPGNHLTQNLCRAARTLLRETGIELASLHSTEWGNSNTQVRFLWNSENCKHREVCSRSKKKKHKRGKCKKQEMETYVRIILSWFSEKWLQNFHSSGTFLKCLCKAVEKLENEQRA